MENSERPLMTVHEVIRATGLSRPTVYSALRENRIPGIIRIGRRVLVSRVKFSQWCEGKTV